jgi:hypothetical protein
VKEKGIRKCLCCKKAFVPDPRVRDRQKFCSDSTCQVASKRRSQERWCGKNSDYWRGPDQVRRVQAWRKANPGYSKKASNYAAPAPLPEKIPSQSLQEKISVGPLQDVILPRDPLLVGLLSLLIKSALQEKIAEACRDLVTKGNEILQKRIAVREPRRCPP